MKPDSLMSVGEYFRQCVGIDVSKEKLTACLFMYDIAGDVGCNTNSIEFANNRTGFNQLVKWSRREALKGYEMPYLMEATGVYHEQIAHHLHKIGCTVYVVMPNKARDFADYEGLKTKTDDVDARVLGLLGCVNRHLTQWVPSKPIFAELRELTRFRAHLKALRTKIINYQEGFENSMATSKLLGREYKSLLSALNKRIETCEAHILDKIDSDMELKPRFDRLCSIKGLGPISIAVILAETNGFNLIKSRKQLASYAGLDIKAYQSGSVDSKHHISKKGNKYIRAALYFPAITACRYNNQIKQLTERIAFGNPQTKLIGITAAMRKLLLLTFSLWKNGEVYDPMKE